MERAMTTFKGGSGTLAYPRVATHRVMEWATVNEVMVFKSIHRF
jgi:hypothetical protein